MKTKPLPELETLQNLFSLDETCPSGLRWKKAVGRGKSGEPAGNKNKKNKYFRVGIGGELHSTHRIVFALANERTDIDGLAVDHIDRDRANNNPANLRLATKSQNGMNAITKLSEYRNVWWSKQSNCFCVSIQVDKKVYSKSGFKTRDSAAQHAKEKRKELFGEFYSL